MDSNDEEDCLHRHNADHLGEAGHEESHGRHRQTDDSEEIDGDLYDEKLEKEGNGSGVVT